MCSVAWLLDKQTTFGTSANDGTASISAKLLHSGWDYSKLISNPQMSFICLIRYTSRQSHAYHRNKPVSCHFSSRFSWEILFHLLPISKLYWASKCVDWKKSDIDIKTSDVDRNETLGLHLMKGSPDWNSFINFYAALFKFSLIKV